MKTFILPVGLALAVVVLGLAAEPCLLAQKPKNVPAAQQKEPAGTKFDDRQRIVGTPDKINAYVGQLRDPERRAAAAFALGSFGVEAEAAVPALREVLKEEDPWLRFAAAHSLWKINKDSTAVAGFTELLRYKADSPIPLPDYRGACGACGDARPWDQNSGVRHDAAYQLGLMGSEAKSAIPFLIKSLKDRESSVGCAAALALWRIGKHPAAIPALVSILKHDEISRWYAVRALGEIGPEAKSAVPLLLDALGGERSRSGEEVPTRIQAAVALWRIDKHPAAIPAILEALKDRERNHRLEAAEALGDLGPDGRTAVPALIEALYDEYAPVGDRAAQSLKKIDPKAAKEAGLK